jgi:hypothetical protein
LPRRATAVLLVACGLVAAVLAVAAAGDRRELAFTLNVRPAHAVAEVEPGGEACHWGIQAGATFDVVEPLLGTHGRPGPPLAIAVRELGTGRVLAGGRIEAGARDNSLARGRVEPAVEEGRLIGVCFRNEGGGPVTIFGGPTAEAPGHAFDGIRAGAGDMRLVFYRSQPRSALALVPDMFERAALFRPDPVGAWTFWALLVLVAGGVPLLLAAALRAAASDDPREEPGAAGRT